MNWILLNAEPQLQQIIELSASKPQLIFKHSTRCSISSVVRNRLEREQQPAAIDFYFLDLIAHRNISNKVAEIFHIEHESPQALLIKNGKCVYNESHSGIHMDEIIAQNEKAEI